MSAAAKSIRYIETRQGFHFPPDLTYTISLRSRRKWGRRRGARTSEKNGRLGAREEETSAINTPIFFISAHRFTGNLNKLTVNATTNQKQACTFLHG